MIVLNRKGCALKTLDFGNIRGHVKKCLRKYDATTVSTQLSIVEARSGNGGAWRHILHIGNERPNSVTQVPPVLTSTKQAMFAHEYTDIQGFLCGHCGKVYKEEKSKY